MSTHSGGRTTGSGSEGESEHVLIHNRGVTKPVAERLPASRPLVTLLAGALAVSSVLLVIVSSFALLAGDAGAGQPVATVIGGAGVLTAGLLTFRAAHQTWVSNEEAAKASLEHAAQVASDGRRDALAQLAAQKQQSDALIAAQAAAATQVHQREVNRDLRLRYTTAAEQLAHASSAVRLAGVYALASLADEWHQQGDTDEKQVSIDLLRAYLRTPNSAAPVGGIAESDLAKFGEQEVRKTILLTLLTRSSRRIAESKSWRQNSTSLSGSDLRGLDLKAGDLRSANLSEADLSSADLSSASLHNSAMVRSKIVRARLYKANLSHASLDEVVASEAAFGLANLEHATVRSTDLSGASFKAANLAYATISDVDLSNATFPNAALHHADISDVDFAGATLEHADLRGVALTRCLMRGVNLRSANLTDAHLEEVNLSMADLDGATMTGASMSNLQLSDVFYTADTTWPTNFHPPPSRTVR